MKATYLKQIFERAKAEEQGLWIRYKIGFEVILVTKVPEKPGELNFLPIGSTEMKVIDDETVSVVQNDGGFAEVIIKTPDIFSVTRADPVQRQAALRDWQSLHAMSLNHHKDMSEYRSDPIGFH